MANHTSEAELRSLLGQGLTVPQIAEKLGITPRRIKTVCVVLGLATDAETYFADIKAGLNIREIAAKHGTANDMAVYRALRRAGHPTTLRELIRREQQTV